MNLSLFEEPEPEPISGQMRCPRCNRIVNFLARRMGQHFLARRPTPADPRHTVMCENSLRMLDELILEPMESVR